MIVTIVIINLENGSVSNNLILAFLKLRDIDETYMYDCYSHQDDRLHDTPGLCRPSVYIVYFGRLL